MTSNFRKIPHDFDSASDDRGGERIPTFVAFAALVLASVGVSYYANTFVLTDDVYRVLLADQGAATQADMILAQSNRWTRIGYLLNPVSLSIRVTVAALVVQLGLLAFGVRAPLGRVFRAAVWAQWALLFGSAVRNVWMGMLPTAARTAERFETVPGSGEWLLGGLGPFDPAWSGLLRQITIYQIGWVVLFVLALEKRDRIPLRPAALVVVAVWVVSVLSRWGIWSYLGLGAMG